MKSSKRDSIRENERIRENKRRNKQTEEYGKESRSSVKKKKKTI